MAQGGIKHPQRDPSLKCTFSSKTSKLMENLVQLCMCSK